MSPLETLGFALGTSFASGLNLYATVAAAGLMQRFGVVQLPDSLQVLSHPIVLGVAITLFLVEFIADKIPYVDSAWDALHTFIRPPAAAVLSYSAFGNVPEEYKIGAALLAGGVALTSHGAKASARAAANTSPEPVSNWALSIFEDGLAVFLVWMSAQHPFLTAGIRTGAAGYRGAADPEALEIRMAARGPDPSKAGRIKRPAGGGLVCLVVRSWFDAVTHDPLQFFTTKDTKVTRGYLDSQSRW